MLRIATFTLLLWSIPLLSLAETVYVSDNLRVGVRSAPNNNIAPHGVVITGMRLEILKHAGRYIKIRNDKGVEGWIKDTYVTPDKPAKLLLQALQAEQAKLRAQLSQQRNTIKDATSKAAAMSVEVASLKTANSELQSHLRSAMSDTGRNKTVGYVLYAAWLVMLGVAGFVVGVIWQRKQAMKRLGG